ncbi:MAG TPA: mechanosensitive ion channel family protein [Acidimicrobiales bacterium]|nr:mechanosensitive ion channel family protein [Acidimicrobiales bacterium]
MPIASLLMTLAATAAGVAQSPAAGAVSSPGAGAACGPVENASAVCLAVFNATGNSAAAHVAQTVLVLPFKIGLILLGAFVAQRLVRRTIRRLVRAMSGERSHATASGQPGDVGPVREHAPRLLFDANHAPSVRRAQRSETIGALLRSVSAVAIWSVAILMAMAELGLNLGPLIAGAGIVGIALGFGAQNLVRDFVSGVFMLAEDQYGVGDVIDAGPATGKVEGVSLRTTRLRDVNGTVWHMPNGEITRVGNKSQQWARAVLDVDVAYDTDIPRATQVIKATADRIWHDQGGDGLMLEEPEVWGVENLGADGIAIRLVVKTAPNEQLTVARQLRAHIKQAFDEAGIEIPFPQRTVWHRMEDGATTLVPVGKAGGGGD